LSSSTIFLHPAGALGSDRLARVVRRRAQGAAARAAGDVARGRTEWPHANDEPPHRCFASRIPAECAPHLALRLSGRELIFHAIDRDASSAALMANLAFDVRCCDRPTLCGRAVLQGLRRSRRAARKPDAGSLTNPVEPLPRRGPSRPGCLRQHYRATVRSEADKWWTALRVRSAPKGER
jgi:hypothetical protein